MNENEENIAAYWKTKDLTVPQNLTVYPRQEDVVPFYNRASLILNLTNKDKAIETFGLTALEAMTAGLPVIVPTVGGIAEMVEDGMNGYRIDVQDRKKIKETIKDILTDKELFISLSNNAQKCSKRYSRECMIEQIGKVLEKRP